jgi:PKD repeat protein
MYTAEDYDTITQTITIADKQKIVRDIQLTKNGTVIEPPVANFIANVTEIWVGDSVMFTDLSENSPTAWEWTFEGGTPSFSTEQNPTVFYFEEGDFDVTLKVFKDNIAKTGFEDVLTKTSYINVAPSSDIADKNDAKTIKIYPNPAKNMVNVEADFLIKEIEISDMMGRQVFFQKNNSNKATVKTSHFVSGLYLLKIKSDSGYSTARILIAE